jgi:hypothetical protein
MTSADCDILRTVSVTTVRGETQSTAQWLKHPFGNVQTQDVDWRCDMAHSSISASYPVILARTTPILSKDLRGFSRTAGD